MTSRWDFVHELKPLGMREHALERFGDALAEELARWPLPLDAWSDPRDETRYRALLERHAQSGARGPSPESCREAFKLANLELGREFEAHEAAVRALPTARRDESLLLFRYLVEWSEQLMEATEGRLRRADLMRVLERACAKLEEGRLVIA